MQEDFFSGLALLDPYWDDSVTIRFYREILTMNTDMERMRKQSPYPLKEEAGRYSIFHLRCFRLLHGSLTQPGETTFPQHLLHIGTSRLWL